MKNEEDEKSYLISAELYDMLSEQHWSTRQNDFLRVLKGLKNEVSRVVDIGTGTGKSLSLIAQAFPGASIHAIEPSTPMRIALMTRILSDNLLRHCVSVYPVTFDDFIAPEQYDVLLICGCIGFLNQDERLKLWKKAARELSSGGAVIIDNMAISSPQVIEKKIVANTYIGTQRYEIHLSGIPVEDTDLMCWEMQFDQYSEDQLLRRNIIHRHWHTQSLETLIEEASEAGFRCIMQEDKEPVPVAWLQR